MAILKTYHPAFHDIHSYLSQVNYSPSTPGIQNGYSNICQGFFIDWSGVSLRPRAFCTVVPENMRTNWSAPFEEGNINFYNTCNPCAVLISPKHALICQHYRGTQERTNETYQFMGKSGNKYTRTVIKATLNVGVDHTLLEFDQEFPTEDVKIYNRIADVRYIPKDTHLWVHDNNSKAYKILFKKGILTSADGVSVSYQYAPCLDGFNNGIKLSGDMQIFVGDSGSPTFVEGVNGETLLIGLLHGGMQINHVEIQNLNSLMENSGYTVEHVKLSAKKEDLNQDGAIDGADLGLLFASWSNGDAFRKAYDINGDGTIDGNDLGMLFAEWGVYDMSMNIGIQGGVIGLTGTSTGLQGSQG